MMTSLLRTRTMGAAVACAAPSAAATARRSYSSRPVTTAAQQGRRKVTILDIQNMYSSGTPISMITAHDYPSGLVADRAGVDVVLVGDSLAMVALGYESTNQVTMDEMLHHCRAVARGSKNPFLVCDMPFGSYQVSPEQALTNAVRFITEGRAEAVKLEGGREMAATVERITKIGVPVVGHIGLTPQTTMSLGGFRVQGKTADSAINLVEDALALQDAGCFAIVIEAVPSEISLEITKLLSVPTIGIGAGPHTNGQVLVQNDALGVFDRFVPKFCKQFATLQNESLAGLTQYHNEVKSGVFPTKDHCYPISEEQVSRFKDLLKNRRISAPPLSLAV